MNNKVNHQNLLWTALRPLGTKLTRLTVTLAVVLISLFSTTTAAWAQQGQAVDNNGSNQGQAVDNNGSNQGQAVDNNGSYIGVEQDDEISSFSSYSIPFTILLYDNGQLTNDPSVGSAKASPDPVTAGGAYVTITATPTPGYKFKEWQVAKDLSGPVGYFDKNSSSFSFTHPGGMNVSFTAVFEVDPNYKGGSGQSGKDEPGTGGTSQAVTEPEIRILSLSSGWDANGATVAASYLMGGETVEYTSTQFGEEPAPVPEGETVSLTITPGEGYLVDEVSVKKYEAPIFVIGESRTRGTDAEASVEVSHTDGTNVWSFTMPAYDVEVTVTYKAKPAPKTTVQSNWITVNVGEGLTYDGSSQTPGVTVTDGTTDVTSEFDVSYSNNMNACEATATNAPTVTVTAKTTSTSYTGTASKTFTIARKALKLVADPVSINQGDALPTTFTGNITGFVDGEGLGENDVLTFTLDNTEALEVGKYSITGRLAVNGGDSQSSGNYGTNYTFANDPANETAFIFKIAVKIKIDNPEQLVAGSTYSIKLLETEYAPQVASQSYSYNPVSGVMVDAHVEFSYKSTSGNVAIYEVTVNRATKLTFTNVEWNGTGALFTRLTNINFKGADVDTSKLHFNNLMSLSADSKMTLCADFGDAVGTITGNQYTFYGSTESEGYAYLSDNNLEFIAITGAQVKQETHNVVMNMDVGICTLAFNDCHIANCIEGLALSSKTGADATSTFASIGGAASRYKTGSRGMIRGSNATRPYFSFSYSGARIMAKAEDVELRAVEEVHGKTRGAAEQDIIIESGKEYDILTEEDLVLTLKLSEGDILITSITLKVPEDPNDINHDGLINAADIVKAITDGKTQAEIDAVVDAIMEQTDEE